MRRRRLLLLGFLVLVASYLVAGGAIDLVTDSTEPETLERDQLIQVEDGGSYLWPYTSRDLTTEGRTLAINMIIHGDDDRVRQALVDSSELEWEEADPDEQDAETDTYEADPEERTISWDDARGSTRYTYIDTGPHGGGGIWFDESYQLHAGSYLGSRYHIRAYTTTWDDWTAVQAHQEYWDWFRLRHTVTDIQDARNVLEADFIDQPYVNEVSREYHGTTGGRNDGWLSVIRLVTVVPLAALGLFGSSVERTRALWRETTRLLQWVRRNSRGFILAAVLAGLFLGVRSAGLLLETTLSWITPKAFVAILYPILVVGLPLAAVVFSRPLETATRFVRLQWGISWLGEPLRPQSAFVFTVVGLGLAFILDFAGLGISVLPIELMLHRLGLLFALGLIAAGAARTDLEGNSLLAVGTIGWIVGLAMPLLGYI
ncbi:hypothetical protein [Halalkalicoccus subterraneus]|uniref:hypothetical protein n=1 Tax=Halalkalicoccus subterraneus TaxID=2675002 RepID=UPI000EFB6C15|nr:hypothetical protein [Halalkalicoccus subterraneus]